MHQRPEYADQEIIQAWRKEGEKEGYGWMLVIHDSDLNEDYPVFYDTFADMEAARLRFEAVQGYQRVRFRIEV